MNLRYWLPLALLSLAGPVLAEPATNLQLTLPTDFYAVPGVPMGVWFDNVVLTETPEAYTYTVASDLGTCDAKHWSVTPTAAQVGDHPWALTVKDQAGAVLGEGKMTLHVVKPDAGAGKSLTLLIVGDSLTGATAYVNEIGRLLSEPNNPTWTMLGTVHPSWAKPAGVAHEGYGGWRWQTFVQQYFAEPVPAERKISSPFVFAGPDGKPVLDVKRYFAEKAGGKLPDVITVLLGINDNFGANPDDPAAIDKSIDSMFGYADTLLKAFREAAPNADIGLGLTTPPNSREAGFAANYTDKKTGKVNYHRWGWKRIQHRLVQRQLGKFRGREAEHLFVVPTELNLDPVEGYPDNNGVHPNVAGYNQIGQSFYAWLKWRLQARPS